jgi:hypothetical protein
MNESNERVRPATRVLKRLVGAALAKHKPSYHGTEPCALLLLEPNCTELPSALIEDTVLEPVDKLIWLLLMIRARRGKGVTLMPAHRELARSANVTARQTVSRSLSILRCRRWLTVCHTSWRKDGQRRGSAYALHAAPLPIADTIYLDPRFAAFLDELSDQNQGRVQKAASAVLGQMSHQTDGEARSRVEL